MGTIVPRKRKNGSVGYTAQIVIKQGGAVVYRKARTFDRRAAASLWIETQEKALKSKGGLERAKGGNKTLADAIDLYVAKSLKEIGRTKAQVLQAIKKYDIGSKAAGDIGSQDVVAFAEELSGKMKPQTVANYLSHLGAVFAIAKPAWGIPLDREAMKDAFTVLKRLGITAKSDKRDRRPTIAEIDKLMDYFTAQEARHPGMAPMARIVPFALFSTRRLGEICRIEWKDFDAEGKRVLVRDMKHPGEKIGNDQWVDVPEEAIGFMGQRLKIEPLENTSATSTYDEVMGKSHNLTGRIFPYSEEAIGANFTRACKLLEIEDLHFHDLRHEGVSRLFELGWTIPRAATVSGHRSWQSLQRYSHLRQTGDKWKDWKWLPRGGTKE